MTHSDTQTAMGRMAQHEVRQTSEPTSQPTSHV